ncbi:GNAT family N-acetyltransferase [Haloglycomyces albus]|uniref:GNAT family N-acetyltransferase n=1 Tax=Haloglycomyces albus TaxID=526067 RepID=UPI00046CFE79|nr:GNAT family N-acetyltransferase [Haloglycomyces albus]
MAAEIVDNDSANRYEAWDNGELVGLSEYRRSANQIAFIHTEVNPDHKGEGIGAQLATVSLDEARQAELSVVPACPFYEKWIKRHPEYSDLVSAEFRKESL